MSPIDAGITAINERYAADNPQQALCAAKCRALLYGYDARWLSANVDLQTEACEVQVFSELYNPDTGAKSRTFRMGGKIDLRGERHGRRVLVDHKTCSEDITDPNATYWRQLVIEGQPSHYMLIEALNGRKVDEAIWDVIRKPTISPKQVAGKGETNDILNSGFYFGQRLSPESLEQFRSTGRETLEMYEARLRYDCTEVRREWYFQRRTVPRLDQDILEYAREIWQHTQDLIRVRRDSAACPESPERPWVRNPGACMNYGRPCVYLGICSGHDSADSDKWMRKEWVHNELEPEDGDGRDVLTNSRIRCFQTCRRKHFYSYELGLERVEDEDVESLFIGTLMHSGLEAYFNAAKESNGISDPANVAGSEFANVGTTAE